MSTRSPLLLLEAAGREPEVAPVLRDDPDGLLGRPAGDGRLDLEGHRDVGADEAHEVRDHLIGDAAGVAADPARVKPDRAVVAGGCRATGRQLGWLDAAACSTAARGTTAVIWVLLLTVNTADSSPKRTLVAPVRLLPLIP